MPEKKLKQTRKSTGSGIRAWLPSSKKCLELKSIYSDPMHTMKSKTQSIKSGSSDMKQNKIKVHTKLTEPVQQQRNTSASDKHVQRLDSARKNISMKQAAERSFSGKSKSSGRSKEHIVPQHPAPLLPKPSSERQKPKIQKRPETMRNRSESFDMKV
jgi:hypothetical protein